MAKRSAKKGRAGREYQGESVDILRTLLDEGRREEVLGVVSQLLAKNNDLTAKNAELERRLALLLSHRKKNEGVSTDQLLLFISQLMQESANDSGDEDGALSQEMVAANKSLRDASEVKKSEGEPGTRPPRRPAIAKPFPASIPRRDNPISVDEADRACQRCHREMECIGHDVTEVAELDPAKIFIRRDICEKLACRNCDGEAVRAPAGITVVEGGRLGPHLVSGLLVDKYSDGLPLHRQKERFARMGLDVSISTLADQVTWITDLLRPVWRAAIADVLASKVMHLDGTGLPVLDRSAPSGKRLGTLWGYVGNKDIAAYLYTATGAAKGQREGELGPADMLALRSGFTVADAANIFETSFKRSDLIECGCNTHARRYFVKALDAGDTRAALPIGAYKKLYTIEAEVVDASDEERLAVRREKSRPVFDQLVAWAKVYQPHEPPASLMGAAIRYLTNHQVALGRFLEAGEVPIDNSIVERLHVRAALVRKNFLFAGSDAGGDRAAIALTVLGCCRLVGVDPLAYLTDVVPRLTRKIRLRDVVTLLPARWKAARGAS